MRGDRAEHQGGHQPHRIARCPVLTRFLVVLLVEAAHQLLEHRAHGVVVERRRAEIHLRIEKLADQGAEGIRARQSGDMVPELEVLQYILHVVAEAFKVGLEIGPQFLFAAPDCEIAQHKR